MENITDEKMRELMKLSFKTDEGDRIDWMSISDRTQSVKDDVRRVRNHPLVPGDVTIHGFLFEVETGRLKEIVSE